ncbi:MAG: hypothetical protein BGO69_15320 [Bacteroidetes bacterium 46-16]|nr:MAG: hypothetical protein BGO69_15320 [Bacteroidetes bacterium 46-16]
MEKETIKDKLRQLTDGMLYISESDFELDVQDWGKQDRASALGKIKERPNVDAENIFELNAAVFFDQTINALDPNDDFAAKLAQQYKDLYAYLKGTFHEIYVYRTGKIQVQVYVVCLSLEGDCFVLHTTSVET